MTDVQFVQLCKETIATYVNDHLDKTDNAFISPDNVYRMAMQGTPELEGSCINYSKRRYVLRDNPQRRQERDLCRCLQKVGELCCEVIA